MGLPSAAGAIAALLGTPDQTPVAGSNKSGLNLAWLDAGGSPQTLRFDTISNEGHEALLAMTDHPVEVGANVVDNAREMPKVITLEGFISSKPLASNPGMSSVLSNDSFDLTIPKKDVQISLLSATSALGNLIDPGPSSATAQRASGDFPNRIRAVFEILSKLQSDRRMITVVSGLTTSLSMMLTRLGAARTLADGTGATFHLELRKVRLVSALLVDAPEPTEARGMIAASVGSKSAKEASAGKKAKSESIIHKKIH